MADLHNVYDLFHPSPPSLQHLARYTVAIDLWRCEWKHHLESDGTLREPDPRRKTSLQRVKPHLPSVIFPMVEEHAMRIGYSCNTWLGYHADLLPPKFGIFHHFTDFVSDFGSGIDYRKTAKRFVHCDEISDYRKFKMACLYCLEDDILRLWPNVAPKLSSTKTTLSECPELHYWIHRLNNRLSEIVLDDDTSCVEEVILKAINEKLDFNKWPSLEYFLNRLDPDVRLRRMLKMSREFDDGGSSGWLESAHIFSAHILSKLDEITLRDFVANQGEVLMSSAYPHNVMRIWEYVKDKMTSDEFRRVTSSALADKFISLALSDLCKIWPSAPSHLKQSAIPVVLKEIPLLLLKRSCNFTLLLSMVLSDTPVKCRRKFWDENSRILIKYFKVDDLQCWMNLCFDGDQSQIIQFRESVLSLYYDLIVESSASYLKQGSFDYLEKYLKFWFANDEQAIRDFQLKLLNDNPDSVSGVIRDARLLNEFVDKVYPNIDDATKFKNQLLMSPHGKAIDAMVESIQYSHFREIMEFIDTFAPSEAIASQIKEENLVPKVASLIQNDTQFLLKDYVGNKFNDHFENFMKWLLRTDDRIARFKEALDVDAIVQRVIEFVTFRVIDLQNFGIDDWFSRCFRSPIRRSSTLKTFLKWYFVTPENFDEFANNYADNNTFFLLV